MSFNSYPRGVYDIHGSFGTKFYCPQERLLCVPTRTDCARVLQIWGLFCYCQFIISNTLAQLLSRHFRLLWPLLQGAHPLHLFLALIHCLPHRLIVSGVHYSMIFLNHLLYSRSRDVSLDWFLTCPLEDWVCTAF